MFDLTNVLLLMLIAVIALLFWQLRQQSERAHYFAVQFCKQNQLQLLDISRRKGKFSWQKRGPTWLADYNFGFSSDHEQRYEGTLRMANLQLRKIDTPVFREPEPAAPASSTSYEQGSYYQ
ncbi:DUF3301 domain-containing protein [Aliidiomarina minuta]|uniref:DUF3301 domain-containing protein n=1 Tax=Aliidiomarina minuta TaxID=880057 RepID=A0A432W5T7_9GAMM|nr:DUF3301 domain-containing protein [Aliidiomarina minuta]RUO25402.1 DUF3301 domain-containing protein [Aliidiomarina minuta]